MLGLFGALALGTLVLDSGGNDNSDGEELPPEDLPPEETAGQEPGQSDTHLLEFTEGNDTLSAEAGDFADVEERYITFDLLGGDDVAQIGLISDVTVLGGDGNDVLSATFVTNTLDGGAGNDTLEADDSNHLLGGAGDDVLNFNHGSYDQGEWGSADGGEGNDTITVHTDALVPAGFEVDVGGVDVRGGSGADEMHVIYELGANEFIDDDGSSYADQIDFDGRFIRVHDFNPAEDRLIVEVDRDPSMIDRGVSLDFTQTEAGGVYTTLLTMTFDATADMPEATNTLTITSNAPFGLEDIQFVDSPPEGQVLAYNGSSLLEGTEGDDTLPAGQDNSLAPERLDLLGGDDVAVIEEQIGVGVFGGTGNDSLTSTVVANALFGGDGNDTLASIDGNDMYGGAGDDLITFDGDVQLGDMAAHINGGAGNDTINIMQDAGVNHYNLGGAIVEGGEGADVFNYVIDLQNSVDDPANLRTFLSPIRDFNPNEDKLSIQVDKSDLTADRDVTIAMEQTEVNGTFTSVISLTFAGTADTTQAVAQLRVTSNAAFGLEDIQFVNV